MTAVIPAGVSTARDIVRPALEAALDRLTPAMRQVAAYHLGLADADGAIPPGSGGGAIPPGSGGGASRSGH